jgi:hypothetical protein
MTDGLGIATLFQCFNGKYDSSALPAMKPISFVKQLFLTIISPFLVLWFMLSMQFMSKEVNSFKKGHPISGKKAFGVVMDLQLTKMKTYCKKVGCTINDYCASLLAISMREYLENEEQRQIKSGEEAFAVPKSIRLAIPFSLRQPFNQL